MAGRRHGLEADNQRLRFLPVPASRNHDQRGSRNAEEGRGPVVVIPGLENRLSSASGATGPAHFRSAVASFIPRNAGRFVHVSAHQVRRVVPVARGARCHEAYRRRGLRISRALGPDCHRASVLFSLVRASCAPVLNISQADSSGLQRTNESVQPGCSQAQIPHRDAGFGSTERHRSRTCLASGYDAVLVLKTTHARAAIGVSDSI